MTDEAIAEQKNGLKPAARAFVVELVLALIAGAVLNASTPRADTQPHTAEQAKRTYNELFSPSQQKPIFTKAPGLTLSLERVEECPKCPARRAFVFQVKHTQDGRISEFSLANETAQIDEAHIVSPERAVVIGRMQANVSVVNVVDLRRDALLDSFWCMKPSVSDDNRFVAYVKLFPLHFVPGVSFEYLVYDLTATPHSNRTPGNRNRSGDRYNVGWPVYPAGALNAPNDNIFHGAAAARTHMMSSDGFFWLHDFVFAFADQWQGEENLVTVNLSSGIANPRVSVLPLTGLGVINTAKCKDLSAAAFQVSDIKPAEGRPTYVELDFRTWNPSCLARHSAVVGPISTFQRVL